MAREPSKMANFLCSLLLTCCSFLAQEVVLCFVTLIVAKIQVFTLPSYIHKNNGRACRLRGGCCHNNNIASLHLQ